MTIIVPSTASLTSYDGLVASIAAWLHRTDLASVIPDFITLAEIRINGDLDARRQDTKVSLTTVANTESVAVPDDMINIRAFSVSSTTPMQMLVYETPESYTRLHSFGESGTPRAYTLIGAHAYLSPIPDAVYTLNLTYKAKIPSLKTNGTTWFMTAFPNVYLYASLLAAATFLRDQDRILEFQEKYEQAIQIVNSQDWFSGSTPRVMTDVRP